jgi:hypothetical protein
MVVMTPASASVAGGMFRLPMNAVMLMLAPRVAARPRPRPRPGAPLAARRRPPSCPVSSSGVWWPVAGWPGRRRPPAGRMEDRPRVEEERAVASVEHGHVGDDEVERAARGAVLAEASPVGDRRRLAHRRTMPSEYSNSTIARRMYLSGGLPRSSKHAPERPSPSPAIAKTWLSFALLKG